MLTWTRMASPLVMTPKATFGPPVSASRCLYNQGNTTRQTIAEILAANLCCGQ